MPRSAVFVAACLIAASLAPTPGIAPMAWAQAPNASFNLVNKSSQTLKELFATPAGFDTWGKNRLDGRSLAAGGSFAVRLPANGNCRYDIRVVTADGKGEDRRGVDTCKTDDVVFSGAAAPAQTVSAAPAAGSAAHIKLINNAASPIEAFFVRKSGAADWGASKLGTGDAITRVAAKSALSIDVPLDGGCIYELRVVFENHQSREKRGADLCRTTELPVQ